MVPSKPVIDRARVTTNPALFKKTADLHISASNKWAANMFANEGIVYVGNLVRMTEAELLRIPNMRKKLVYLIKHELASMGLRLGMHVPGWTPENDEDPPPEPRGNHP
jgi:DNA-directed RNA polymerase subunit alpha